MLGTGTLLTGALGARVISLASVPVLTRLYTPEDYGALSVFGAIVALLAPLVGLSYYVALPLPRGERMALNLLALSLALAGTTIMPLTLGLWLLAPVMLPYFSMERLIEYWWLVPIGLGSASLYETLSMWATRRRAYRLLARTQISQAASSAVIGIGFGLANVAPLGLLLSQVAKRGGGITVLYRELSLDWRRHRTSISLKRMLLAARSYRVMPTLRLPSQLLSRVSVETPVFFVALIFDASSVGQFGLAMTMIALPMSIFGRTSAKAFYAELSAVGRRDPVLIRQITTSVLARLGVLALVPALVLFFLGPWIFALVFGERWMLAGEIASMLAVFLLLQFIAIPAMHILDVLNRQDINIYLNIQRVVLISVSFILCWWAELTIVQSTFLFSLTVSLHYAITIYRCFRCLDVISERKPE